MSSQPREQPTNTGDTSQKEDLKTWSCINCRRRKVRCDRRYPCAPCSKNQADCVFPVSGRVPRRNRDPNYAAQKRSELVGRLRRLEAMVGDLGSQVEHSTGVSQGYNSVEGSTSASSAFIAMSNETGRPDQQEFHNQVASGDTFITQGEAQKGSETARIDVELSQASDDFGSSNSNGDIVVGNRFWTVFCKEVRSSHAIFRIPRELRADK